MNGIWIVDDENQIERIAGNELAMYHTTAKFSDYYK